MTALKTGLAAVLALGALALPVAASANPFHHPHHQVCSWQVHHHHRVKVCR